MCCNNRSRVKNKGQYQSGKCTFHLEIESPSYLWILISLSSNKFLQGTTCFELETVLIFHQWEWEELWVKTTCLVRFNHRWHISKKPDSQMVQVVSAFFTCSLPSPSHGLGSKPCSHWHHRALWILVYQSECYISLEVRKISLPSVISSFSLFSSPRSTTAFLL